MVDLKRTIKVYALGGIANIKEMCAGFTWYLELLEVGMEKGIEALGPKQKVGE